MLTKGNVTIPAPHGRLEAIYRPKNDSAPAVALVLHPHPQHGGTMHNKVVYRSAKALEAAGFAVLRFNFRGVGDSTGSFDGGRGEADDARVALDYLLDSQPKARKLLVAGFSFGAAVGLRVGCSDPRVHRLISIGTPVRMSGLGFLVSCPKPKLFVHGAWDQIAPIAPVEGFVGELSGEHDNRLVRIEGAGHFFDGHLDRLAEVVREFAEEL